MKKKSRNPRGKILCLKREKKSKESKFQNTTTKTYVNKKIGNKKHEEEEKKRKTKKNNNNISVKNKNY